MGLIWIEYRLGATLRLDFKQSYIQKQLAHSYKCNYTAKEMKFSS